MARPGIAQCVTIVGIPFGMANWTGTTVVTTDAVDVVRELLLDYEVPRP